MVGSWSLGPLVEAFWGLRGIDMISAATFIASTGDLSTFESPRLLMGYLGLVLFSGMAATVMLTGCGGNSIPTQTAKSYTLIVAATSGTSQQTSTVTLNVQ